MGTSSGKPGSVGWLPGAPFRPLTEALIDFAHVDLAFAEP